MADRTEIDDVRARTDLVATIEQYVTLRRTGRTYKGLCPFHSEKTPSFHVNPDMGLWKCFGQCSEGGDVIKFVQKIEHLSFVEALERLALRAGVTLETRRPGGGGATARDVPEVGERERLYHVNGLALRYFCESLVRAPHAEKYLRDREIAWAAQTEWNLGFAPDAWEGLSAFLLQNRVAPADAEKAGLISKSERGGYYDKMRDRLIFPIFDVQERPIGFGGRLLGDARPGQPKYWNTPETPVFSKGKTLYGLWRARKAIADSQRAIVVEGYTDVLAAHQAGFENVVATLGTALTEEHVKILARLAPTVLLAFDADSAGLKAAYRAAEIFEAQEVEVRVLDLPEGEDPDSLLRAGRRRDFEQLIENALPLTEYRLVRLIRRSATETDRDRVALFRKALPIVAAVPSVIEREQYVKLLAPYHPQFGAGSAHAEEHIRRDIAACQESMAHPAAPDSRARPQAQPGGATEQAERHLLQALISGDAVLASRVLAGIMPEEFPSPTAQGLARTLCAQYQFAGALDLASLPSVVTDDAQAELLSDLAMDHREPLTVAMLDGEISRLRQRVKERRLELLRSHFVGGEADSAEIQEYQRLQNELKGTRK